MNDLSFATIEELKQGLVKKEYSKSELLNFFIERFKQHDEKIKTALEVFDADSILKMHQSGGGVLDGIPGLIKDIICQKSRITSCASKILANYRATYDATAIDRLKKEVHNLKQ